MGRDYCRRIAAADRFVDYGQTRSRLERLEQRLEVASNQ
jgi:hypothetical protein